MHDEGSSSDVFSASSSAVFGTTHGRSYQVQLKGDTVVAVETTGPGLELARSPVEAAYERVAAAAVATRYQLNNVHVHNQRQAQNWSRLSVVAASAGFTVILAGLAAALLGRTTEGVMAAFAAIVPEIIAVLFYRQASVANQQLQADQRNLIDAERLHQTIELVLTIEDAELRDRLKTSIVMLALRDHVHM